MAERTVSVTSNGVTTTKTIPDRKASASVRTLDVNGQSVTVNRTAPVIKSDKEGQSRPLLSKLVGGAEAAFSLRDLNDRQGNNKILEVRRDTVDQTEQTFLAKELNKIEDWVNGKQETTLPCDIPANPQDIHGFTVSGVRGGVIDGVYSTNTLYPTSNGRIKVDLDTNSNVVIRWTGSQWLWEDDDEGDTYWTSSENKTYPWDVTSWTKGPSELAESTGPVFSRFEGGSIDNSPAAAYSLRKVKAGYTGDAVRIRRASDSVEVNVGFDSDDKISASSPITNVVNTVLANETSFPSGTGAFLSSTSGTTYLNGTIEGKNNVLSGGFDGSGLFGLTLNHTYGIGERFKVRYEVYYNTVLNTGGAPLLTIRNSHSLIGSSSLRAPTDQWFIFEDDFITTASGTNLTLHLSAQSPTVQGGDVFLVANASIEKVIDPADTTATTLGAFLTEDQVVFQPDYTTDDGIGFLSNMTSDLNQTVGGRDASVKFSVVSTGINAVHRGYLSFATPLAGTDGVKVTFEMYRPSGGSSQQGDLGLSFQYGGSNDNPSGFLQNSQDDTWEDFSFFLNGRDNSNRLYHQLSSATGASVDGFYFTGTTGDHIFIRNLKVEQINQGATVHTWYDQSGNGKDATQDTSSEQPKIASTGSLLDDIDFSGDSFLQASSLQEQVPVSIFSVNRFDSTLSGFRPFIGNGILDSNSEGYGLLYNDPNNTFRSQVRIPSASTNLDNTASTSGNVKALTTAIINPSAVTSFYNGGNETSVSNTQGAVTPNRTLTIGGSETGSPSSVTRFFNGGISEIILYSTNQFANRFKIESNINNYYGIYTAANDGFVKTWYDQSGNGNDASQPTKLNQPKIVNSGSLTTQGGKPCLDFDGVDDVLQFSAPDVQSGNIRSVFVACSAPTSQKKSVMGTEGEYVIKRDSSRAISLNNFSASRLNSAFSFGGTITHLVTVIRNYTASSSSLSLDGDVDATRTDSYGLSSVHQIGGKKSGSNIIEEADFNCLEVVVYASDQTANRTAIEANIANQYNLNLS